MRKKREEDREGQVVCRVRGESVHDGQEALRVSGHSKPASVHGGRNYWRMMRLAAASRKALEGSFPSLSTQTYSLQIGFPCTVSIS